MKAIRSGLDRYLSSSPQRKSFSIIQDKAFKPSNEALDASLKDLARQGLITSTKHRRPISSEDLEALYAAAWPEYSGKPCKYCMVLHPSLLRKKRP